MSEGDKRLLPWDDPEADVVGLFKYIRTHRGEFPPMAFGGNYEKTTGNTYTPGIETSVDRAARLLLTQTTGWKDDEHGRSTPQRFVSMLEELTTPIEFEFTTFPADGYDEMIIVNDIPFTSVCNHHVIPFVGKAWVGYIPNEKMAGLSKFVRVVHYYAKRLQVQERLTNQIVERVMEELDPLGAMVVMEAEHFCMTVRGVQVPGTTTTTSAVRGVFAEHDRTAKSEFLRLIGK